VACHIPEDWIFQIFYLLVQELKTNLMSLVIFYFTYYLLNMFRTLICPSSGACDCVEWITSLVILFSFRCVLGFAASTCKTDTTKHHPQQTPTHNEKRTR
jgi:hypothetical protein